MAAMAKKLDSLTVNSVQDVNVVQGVSIICCDYCSGNLPNGECLIASSLAQAKHANAVGADNFNRSRNDPYSNCYNPSYKNHSNLSWSNTQNIQNQPKKFETQEKKRDIDDIQHAGLPSQTEVNPKGKEQCLIITLRNGNDVKIVVDLDAKKMHNCKKQKLRVDRVKFNRTLTPIDRASSKVEKLETGEKFDRSKPTLVNRACIEKVAETSITPQTRYTVEFDWLDSSKSAPLVKAYVPLIPFPQRLKNNKKDTQFSKFLEVFKELQINFPFEEALEHMPSYAMFMKEILSKKRKVKDYECV
ncbi:uncharacterized protein LOC119991523 [Tripterygium wilfordii]|uniref:uncharacterized protein LOC119991523 n=1 Tax=Tripterygium wilfordii TaxID=458696 RepID=UPI0018F800B4|nr:uncharacterized protein LOC119991523 [Tripterygium wilfordii]